MQNSIRFQGLSLTPDEHSAPQGSLALCAGVELHDGSLRPSVVSGTPVNTPLKDTDNNVVTLIYVHETTAYRHFIAERTAGNQSRIFWFNSDGSYGGIVYTFNYNVKLRSIESIGNTIVMVADDAIHYAIFKDSTYTYIGTQPPFLPLQFGVSKTYKSNYDRSTIENDSDETEYYEAWRQLTFSASEVSEVKNNGQTVIFKSDAQGDITTAMWALINETDNNIAKKGHFSRPFMVRYCYRLYDGSMIMHSAPVYIPVTGKSAYKVYFENASKRYSNGEIFITDSFQVIEEGHSHFNVNKFCMRYEPANVALRYRLLSESTLNALKTNWSDIIKSVDIFITPPIVREDSSQLITSARVEDEDDWKYYFDPGKKLNGAWVQTPLNNVIIAEVSGRTLDSESSINVILDVPMLSMDAFRDKIRDQASFYRIHSFVLESDTMQTEWAELPIDKSAVEHVATQEKMTDDYKTHNQLMPIPSSDIVKMNAGAYIYNHRLNLYGLREKLFNGFSLDTMLPCVDYCMFGQGASTTVTAVFVELQTDEGLKIVRVPVNSSHSVWVFRNLPVFYPDSRATRMIIATSDYFAVLPLKQCPELNGAMYVGNFSNNYDNTTLSNYVPSSNDIVNLPNKIYTSQTNNPFYFPLEGINTVGVGSIMGIAAATRALSQGQFGQFPLMVFATDGIWALAVSSTGTYSAAHNISREVVSNPASIVQLDQSVAFVTARSLSRVVESSVTSMSEVLDGPWFDCATKLPKLASYFDFLPADTEDEHNYKLIIQQLMAFSDNPIEYFQSCRILYDYASSRLILMPSEVSEDDNVVVFVYSIRSGTWSTMLLPTPLAAINSNPYPYIQRKDGSVRRLDLPYDYNDAVRYPGIVVTRTLKLSEVISAISGFSQNHDSQEKCTLFLYGSHDNINWRYVGKSTSIHSDYLPAHSYRYFRLAVFSRLSTNERYMSVTLATKDKYRKF